MRKMKIVRYAVSLGPVAVLLYASASSAEPAAEPSGSTELTAEQRALHDLAGTQGEAEAEAGGAKAEAGDKAVPKESQVRGTFGEYLSYLGSTTSLTGYGEVRLHKKTDDTPLLFEAHKVALVISSGLADWIFFETELEAEHNGKEIKLEYAILDLEFRKWLLVRVGLMLIPFGQFNEIWHPSFRNRLVLRPLVYKNTFPATYGDAGLQVRGLLNLGRHDLGYAVYVVNGLRSSPGEDSGSIRDMRENTLDFDSSHKAFGGRVWADLRLGSAKLTGGGSVYSGVHQTDPARWLTILGADLLFQYRDLEFLAEWAMAMQEREAGSSLKKNGAYFQLGYTLLGRVQTVVRFDLQLFPGQDDDVWQVVPGLNLILIDGVIWKFNYYLTRNMEGDDNRADEFISELAFSF